MTIGESIDHLKSAFTKVIREENESVMQEKFLKAGLNKKMIENLVSSYQAVAQAKNNVGDVWDNKEAVVGDENNSDVIGLQRAEDIAIEKFWKLTEMYAILVVAKKLKTEEGFKELWEELEKRGIEENQIPDYMLRMTYKYYKQTQTIPGIEQEKIQLNQKLEKSQSDYGALEGKYAESQSAVAQISSEKAEIEEKYENQVKQNEAWRKQLISLIERFIRRIKDDEKEYEKAISQNQSVRKVLGKIKDKINQNHRARKLFGEILEEEMPEEQLLQTLLRPSDSGLEEAKRILSESISGTPEISREDGNVDIEEVQL